MSFGFTQTQRGEFAVGSTNPALRRLFTSGDESADYDDEPMSLTELRDSIRRVLGVDLPLGEPTRPPRRRAATIDEPTETAAPALREALSCWFGTPPDVDER